MRVLSIQLGHNATVALGNNGRIVGVLSQEKVDNIKNSSTFPKDAINELLSEIGWIKSDIEVIMISGLRVFAPNHQKYTYDNKNRQFSKSILIRLAKKMRDGLPGRIAPWVFNYIKSIRDDEAQRRGKDYLDKKLRESGFQGIPIEHVEHHLCHARAAYHSLNDGRDVPALIFTADGMGDYSSSSIYVVKSGNFQKIAETPISSSLGLIYSRTTRFLGMKPLEHEYKVMGLAPYAKDKYMLETYKRIFKPVIRLNSQNPLVFEASFNTSNFYNYLVENAVGERFDNIAAALQHLTEELITQWIRAAIKQTGIRNIYTGGGLFMNVKLNRRIQEMEEVERASFMPSCGDESNPIGAYFDYAVRNGLQTKPLSDLYLGLSYTNEMVAKFIHQYKLHDKYQITYHDDIEEKIADLLSNKEIVARVSGRCEWGARSLGNRAILAHPSYMESFYAVNDYIKSRDFWMPFAPSILDSAAPKYLKDFNPNKAKAPYMITAFAASELGVKHLRAALHQGDHTLRPQVLEESASPKYYRLIKLFEEKTGVGAVLNTSLNLHGYPLVASLQQALQTLENSELKFLAMENYLLEKI